jgi:hypothetical protein
MEETTIVEDNFEQDTQEYIQKILLKPIDPFYNDIKWSAMPSEIEQTLISFLSHPHPDGEEHGMYTRTGRFIKIKLNIDSGTIFHIKLTDSGTIFHLKKRYVIAIYIGESNIESGAKVSYFYISGDSGISYWEGINSTNLKDQKKLDIDILRTVLHSQKAQKVLFKKSEEIPSHKGEIYKNLGMFHDGKIICSDGDVLINRMILCMRSNFFFVYFTKYTKDHHTIKMDVNKIVMEKYMEFLFLDHISVDVLISHSVELLDFGNMIGDNCFIQWIYHKLWDLMDDEKEKMNLNQLMKMYQLIC